MSLLGLHSIAQGGDGLLSPFLERLLEQRRRELDPRVVPLRRLNPAIPDSAGAAPSPSAEQGSRGVRGTSAGG